MSSGNVKGVNADVISIYALRYGIGDRMSLTMEAPILSTSLDEVRAIIISHSSSCVDMILFLLLLCMLHHGILLGWTY